MIKPPGIPGGFYFEVVMDYCYNCGHADKDLVQCPVCASALVLPRLVAQPLPPEALQELELA